jgi:outer membrane lipoprotein carrier protein
MGWCRVCALLLGLAVLVPPLALLAETTSQAQPLVKALEDRYRDVKTLKAFFLQTYRDGRSGIQVESGTVYFSRPGRMRWEYKSPETKLFLADGKTVWFYVPADRMVTRSKMKESDDWRTPFALLTGKADLSRLCERISVGGPAERPGHTILNCIPRGTELPKSSETAETSQAGIFSPAPYDRVLLEIDSSTGELADVRILQHDGVELEFRFGQWVQGLPLETDMFRFDPPPGIAVLDDSAER